MKRKSYFIGLICLALVFGLCAAPAQAIANGYSLSLEVKDGSGTAKTVFTLGEKLYLHIIATELQGVAGCAFTLNYDPAVLTAPTTDTDGVAATGITSLFPFTFVKVGHLDTGAVTMRENSATAGKILFSGASINTATGGAKNTTSTPGQAFPLFIVEFTVTSNPAAVGPGYAFSLVQTTLNNEAAGYAAAGETVPVLVGAVPNTDTINWDNLSGGAFPVLLSIISPVPSVTFGISSGLTVAGMVNYSGLQTGNLKVAAFTDSSLMSPVGSGFSATWPGTSTPYSISVPGSVSYYIAAYIDSGVTGNGSRDAWEAHGVYLSNPLGVSGNLSGKDITLLDPDNNSNGLPDWWEVKYGLYSLSAPIDKNADYDHDGYSNLVEYQGYASGKNPTVVDAPGGTGYNPALDTRSFTISGTISYHGTQTGSLYVAAFAPADTAFATPIGAATPVAWSGTSKTYSLTVFNATYVVAAFIDFTGNGTRDASEAQGASASFTVSGTSITNKNLALMDSTVKAQVITAAPASVKMRAGGSFNMDVNYNTTDGNNNLIGLGLRIHYDSTKLTFNSFSNVLTTSFLAQDSTPQNDINDDDGDPATDKFLQIAWTDFAPSPVWPNAALPLRLYTVNFTVNGALSEGATSNIRFSASDTANGYVLSANAVPFEVKAFTLDIDGNGQYKPLTDGMLIIRYLFGFRGTTLINGAVATSPAPTRSSSADIEAYIAAAVSSLDIDGNGQSKPLTDGMLLIRYLFGFRGTTLINGAVATSPAPTRSSGADIEAYIGGLKP